MLKLIYDVRCGFKELFMTAKNCEFDISFLCMESQNDTTLTEKEVYKNLTNYDQEDLEEYLEDAGVLELISNMIIEDYGHTYFKDICFADKDKPYLPGYIKIFNLRVKYENAATHTIEINCKNKSKDEIKEALQLAKYQIEGRGLSATDVMAILGISRQTLSNWVKRGLIKTTKTAGGHYVYNAESVYSLKK